MKCGNGDAMGAGVVRYPGSSLEIQSERSGRAGDATPPARVGLQFCRQV